MSDYRVAIVADEASPAGGTAVVRIDGLKAWPANATLRIRPIDEAAVPPRSEGWPWGDIVPLRVEPTKSGVDVVLGPDIVGSARLTPGTPITIQVPAARIDVEARWPSLTPTVRRRASAIAMSAGQLLSAKAEREQAEKLVAARRQELAEFAVKTARDAGDARGAAGTSMDRDAGSGPRREDAGQLARLLQLRRPDRETAGTTIVAPATLATAAAIASATSPRRGGIEAPALRAHPAAGSGRPRRLASSRWSFAAGLATMAAIGIVGAAFAPASWMARWRSGAEMPVAGSQHLSVVDLQDLFKDLAATGSQSPKHKAAAGVDTATALSLADHSLRGERTPAETGEAVFWLKRAVSSSFGDANMGWALTQLGTIYATPGTPQHSYVKAHTLWQLAAALGDPVAHCFLGVLYEHGLGVVRSRRTALLHYRAAQAAGACKGADDAVARLSD